MSEKEKSSIKKDLQPADPVPALVSASIVKSKPNIASISKILDKLDDIQWLTGC